jgi:cytochrome c oxidase assembly protein subunit 11
MTPHAKTGAALAGVAALMVSLSFAAVPFYDWFCRVTGFAGTPGQAEAAQDQILDEKILVRFDASLESGMPWTFAPQQRQIELRIGESALAFYEVHNPTDMVLAGTASYNVIPDQAGAYFIKIECFCFTEQVLQPGESAVLPLSFYVDPAIVEDPEAADIGEITLSYTFHLTPLPETQAALAPADPLPVN